MRFKSPEVTLCTTKCKIKKFYVLLAEIFHLPQFNFFCEGNLLLQKIP
jgi:hypothetical protein